MLLGDANGKFLCRETCNRPCLYYHSVNSSCSHHNFVRVYAQIACFRTPFFVSNAVSVFNGRACLKPCDQDRPLIVSCHRHEHHVCLGGALCFSSPSVVFLPVPSLSFSFRSSPFLSFPSLSNPFYSFPFQSFPSQFFPFRSQYDPFCFCVIFRFGPFFASPVSQGSFSECWERVPVDEPICEKNSQSINQFRSP